jgi:hypothetical protein
LLLLVALIVLPHTLVQGLLGVFGSNSQHTSNS